MVLDAKGRLTVPVRHRDALVAACDGQLTLTQHPDGCLLIFPRPAWEAFRRVDGAEGSPDGWRRLYLGSATDVDIDGGSRVLMPPELRAWAGLDKDVLLMGMGPTSNCGTSRATRPTRPR